MKKNEFYILLKQEFGIDGAKTLTQHNLTKILIFNSKELHQ